MRFATILFLFYIYFWEIDQSFIFKRFLFSLFTKFLSFQQSSPKAEIKLHEHEQRSILQHTHCDLWKAICASFAWHAFFSVDVCTKPWYVLQWNLSMTTYPSILKVFLQGLVQKGIPPKFVIVLILTVQWSNMTPCLIWSPKAI